MVLIANAEDSNVPEYALSCILVLIMDTFTRECDHLPILEHPLTEHLAADPVGVAVWNLDDHVSVLEDGHLKRWNVKLKEVITSDQIELPLNVVVRDLCTL